jgi:hypothetical protein
MKIIFLDIDGVLNGYNKWIYFLINISKKLHIPARFMRNMLKIFEVKEKYVKRLSKIVKRTGAKIVMSSSWRRGYWYTPYDKKFPDQKRLEDLLKKYNIEVIDITPSCKRRRREDEINHWLNETQISVTNFVILDDESYDLKTFIGNKLV